MPEYMVSTLSKGCCEQHYAQDKIQNHLNQMASQGWHFDEWLIQTTPGCCGGQEQMYFVWKR
jgi:hypothetical protein